MHAIGIDIGTTSICGILLNGETGEVLRRETVQSNAFLPPSASFEKIQSVEKILDVAKGILDAFITPEVSVIGITGQMHGIVYVDKKGHSISPLYTWQDGRGDLPYKDTTYAIHLSTPAGYGCVTDFYNRENGIRPKEAAYFCTIMDYFAMHLCGLSAPRMHITNAASLGCFDLLTHSFSYDVGTRPEEGYQIIGTYRGVPVSLAIGDNQASVFSSIRENGTVLVNIGTGSQISAVTEKIVKTENVETRPYFEGKYLACGAALCGGRAYSLLKDFFKAVISPFASPDDGEIYAFMDKMANAAVSPLSVDTRFAGTRQNPSLSGSISGIRTENFTPASLTKGILRGMAEELFRMQKEMEIPLRGIVGSGNGIRKNEALKKELEEIFGHPLSVPAHLEEASFGAALYGLIAAGKYKNATDAGWLIRYES